MASHHEMRILPWPPEAIFELVADVESYPAFVPMWRAATVSERDDDGYYTDQEVGFGLVVQRFRTRTRLHRPEWIEVTSIDDAFQQLHIRWQFAPAGEGGCRVDFTMACTVPSLFLQSFIDLMLMPTAMATVSAFEIRARRLFRGEGSA
jgi:coenzyme Q-binding protein COQ10